MIAVLAVSIILLLGLLITLDVLERKSPIEWAESDVTLKRLSRIQTILENVDIDRRDNVLRSLSGCHDGYTLTAQPHGSVNGDARTALLGGRIAMRLAIEKNKVGLGYANLHHSDFSYADCAESEIDLPMKAVVISIQLESGEWFNTEVHPHEWHLQDLFARIFRYGLALIVVGAFSLFLIRRVSRPLNQLTDAAKQFADGLKVSPVDESGPPDLRRTIQSFNAMQQQVADDVKKRTDTLAAISHDLRTPLTALRIRGELVDDEETRADLVASIEKMERVTSSALEYLRGESRAEELRNIDLSALLASECSDFEEAGQVATFCGEAGVYFQCRPDALARAVRNLIENANKYANGARVDLHVTPEHLKILVTDTGPGIPEDRVDEAVAPFRRLSTARESQRGGFGLGLSIVDAVVRGHDGDLTLETNKPSGLIATLRLPNAAPLTG